MKLWRRMAKKDENGRRDGREIKSSLQWSEMMGKTAKRSYPLLDALFNRAGIRYTLTAKQVEALKTIKERNGENVNEVE